MFMIADNLWDEIESLILPRKSQSGRPSKDHKTILNGNRDAVHEIKIL